MASLDEIRDHVARIEHDIAAGVIGDHPLEGWVSGLCDAALALCDELDAREAVTLAVREARWATQHMDDPSERMDIIREAASGPREKLEAARRAREEMVL